VAVISRLVRTPEASIIVVSASDGARLERALPRFRATAERVDHEVVLVLNGAAADVVATADRGAALLDEVVRLEQPTGFAAALNAARAVARGEFLAIVHDDTVPEPGWLEVLVRTARGLPRAGIVGPLVLGATDSVGVAGPVMFSNGHSWAYGAGLERSDPRVAQRRQCDYCAGNSMLVRAEAWDAIGGADDALFPVGYVDADLAFGARHGGWEVWFEPAAAVRHAMAGSLPRGGFRDAVFARNRDVFAEKWADALGACEAFDERDPAAAAQRAVDRARSRRATRGGPPRRATSSVPHDWQELWRDYASQLETDVQRLRDHAAWCAARQAALQDELESLTAHYEALRDTSARREELLEELDVHVRESAAANEALTRELERLRAGGA
jgi:GT2 family glycosyltransferase